MYCLSPFPTEIEMNRRIRKMGLFAGDISIEDLLKAHTSPALVKTLLQGYGFSDCQDFAFWDLPHLQGAYWISKQRMPKEVSHIRGGALKKGDVIVFFEGGLPVHYSLYAGATNAISKLGNSSPIALHTWDYGAKTKDILFFRKDQEAIMQALEKEYDLMASGRYT